MSYTPKVGDSVLFGRGKGEKTRGTVMKVNRTKAKVRQDEARGLQKSHKVGTVWTVPFNLLALDRPRSSNGVESTVASINRRSKMIEKYEGKDLVDVIMDLEKQVKECKAEAKEYKKAAELYYDLRESL